MKFRIWIYRIDYPDLNSIWITGVGPSFKRGGLFARYICGLYIREGFYNIREGFYNAWCWCMFYLLPPLIFLRNVDTDVACFATNSPRFDVQNYSPCHRSTSILIYISHNDCVHVVEMFNILPWMHSEIFRFVRPSLADL